MRVFRIAVALPLAVTLCAGLAGAADNQLGKDLTPVGAERAGNKDGTIPAWEGGMRTPPAGWKVGDPRPDPFADDKKLYTVDATNVDQYKDKLPEGQVHMLKNKKGYRLDVYPSRRTCAYPDWYYDRTAANAGKGKVVDGWKAEQLVGGAVPFPQPKTGAEVLWNFKLRWMGEGRVEQFTTLFSDRSGGFSEIRQNNFVLSPMAGKDVQSIEQVEGQEWLIQNEVTAPAKRVGEIILVHNYLDRPSGDAWLYFPGQRRVRRMPTFAYDNPVPGYDNMEMVDQFPMYAGSIDRYEWKLLGKQEIIVPYNNYKFRARTKDLSTIYSGEFSNRDLMRYELHRVWKVEGTVKSGMRHTALRRVFYFDEDSWQMLHADLFDAQNKLWRIQEGTLWTAWELPACVQQEFISYDISVDRYIAEYVTQDSAETDWLAGREGRVNKAKFDPAELRRQGER